MSETTTLKIIILWLISADFYVSLDYRKFVADERNINCPVGFSRHATFEAGSQV
jgi:hypothetical protein